MTRSITKSLLKATLCFIKDDYFYRASGLTFTTLLAIVPLLVVIVFFMSFLPIFSNLMILAQEYLLQNFVPSATVNIQQYFTTFIQQATTMPTGSLIFLLVTAIMLVNSVEETINMIWRTKKQRKKLLAILFYWLAILLTPLIIGASIFLSSAFLHLEWITKLTELLQLKLLIDFLLPILINTMLFTLLYIVSPNTKVVWQYGLLGGFMTAVIFNFTRMGFVWYLKQFDSYSVIYGVFAVIPIFMVWIYIAWVIIIWGAAFTYNLHVIKKRS